MSTGANTISPNGSAAVPTIATIAHSGKRPLVSVMLPTYQPNRFLIDTLRGVLRQDLGAADMQIAIVDDASPSADVEALVAEAAPGNRVEVHRMSRNLGLSGNWNRCLELARGDTVHVLHQDDVVLDGFYRLLLPAFAKSEQIGMAFCRHAFIDEYDAVTRRSHRERWRAGILRDWLSRITEWQRIQCPSVLVRRSVYERLGGYRSDLCFALDWEMWVRIAANYAVWYQPKTLAYYRRHDGNESSRLQDAGRVSRDVLQTIDTFAEYLPTAHKDNQLRAAYATFARKTLKQIARIKPNGRHNIDELLQPVRAALDRLPGDRRVKHYRKRTGQIVQHWRASEFH